MSSRRIARAGNTIDPAIYEGINNTILRHAGNNEFDKEAAAVLRENYNRMAERLAGVVNARGHSVIEEDKIDRRDKLICQLGATMTASRLRKELATYQKTDWPHDEGKANEYAEYDPRHYYFKILTLKNLVPGDGHMRTILRT